MRLLLPLLILLSAPNLLSAQEFTGQWKGEFSDNSVSNDNWGGERCDYVLELESKNNSVTGYSYTYFTENGKKYYTICKLEGKIDSRQKSIEIREVERTKTNVPVTVNNCLQIHKLTYFKKGKEESLQGTWMPVPNQSGNCGYGKTNLSRRVLDNSFGYVKPSSNTSKVISPLKVPQKTPPASANTSSGGQPVRKESTQVETKKADNAFNDPDKSVPSVKKDQDPAPKTQAKTSSAASKKSFQKRQNNVVSEIQVINHDIRIEMFDNGEIDGDSVSLFYNGMLLVSHEKLSEKPISFNIYVDEDEESELEMYADNLGTIPPNSAVMVIYDGKKRYEVRISSDLQKNGVVRFTYKK